MFTFSYGHADAEGIVWSVSKQRFTSIQEAAEAAKAWLLVCFENDWIIAVKLTAAD